MDARDMQHSQPVFGNRIAYLASKISALSHNIMKLQKRWFRTDSRSDKPSKRPPLSEKWKQMLRRGGRKVRNKDRLWVALYRYPGTRRNDFPEGQQR